VIKLFMHRRMKVLPAENFESHASNVLPVADLRG
jgi:hypothetical protein